MRCVILSSEREDGRRNFLRNFASYNIRTHCDRCPCARLYGVTSKKCDLDIQHPEVLKFQIAILVKLKTQLTIYKITRDCRSDCPSYVYTVTYCCSSCVSAKFLVPTP